MRNNFDDLCIEIEANFNFREVASVMEFLNWKISIDGENQLVVPTETQLRYIAHSMLKDVYDMAYNNKSEFIISGGPFRVEAWYDKDHSKVTMLSLEFICDEYTAFSD